MNIKTLLIGISILSLSNVESQDLGNPNCDSLLLVSSWFSDNVKIYDGCDGTFIRNLDSERLLDGPQSIFEDKNGDVIIVSEQNHKLVKFDRQSLSQGRVVSGDNPNTTQTEPSIIQNPVAAVIDSDQNLILGGFSQNDIVKVNTTNWQNIETILAPSTQHLRGLDIGMVIGPDGQLYVPGFDSNNIIKVNLDTFVTTEVVASDDGLNAPRSIIFHNNQMYVTGWRNNNIRRYDMSGNFLDSFASVRRPTGMIKDGNDHILVASDQLNSVVRINLNTGIKETVIDPQTGNLNGATAIYRLNKVMPEPIKPVNQHWLIGVGQIDGNNVVVENLTTTRGGLFGQDFNPDEISTIDWGSLTINFDGCNSANMSYQSLLQADGYEFGDGGYELFRLANNNAVQECLDIGFNQVTNKGWMSGTWFGGASRSGEGFLFDVLNNNQVIVTWYSYLPVVFK